jgi:hypothetical protein
LLPVESGSSFRLGILGDVWGLVRPGWLLALLLLGCGSIYPGEASIPWMGMPAIPIGNIL